MLTPEEIQSREFLVSLRGYDRDEVHAFLDEVAADFSELLAQVRATAPAVEPVVEEPVAADEDLEPAAEEEPAVDSGGAAQDALDLDAESEDGDGDADGGAAEDAVAEPEAEEGPRGRGGSRKR